MLEHLYDLLNQTPALAIMFLLIVLGVIRERGLSREVDLWRDRYDALEEAVEAEHGPERVCRGTGPTGLTGALHPVEGGWDGNA